jgi:molybdenum-dependent DNA-binding transcriptional regulator ModE
MPWVLYLVDIGISCILSANRSSRRRALDRLEAIHAFVRVVEAGSFSVTARERGVSQSTVSEQVAALEAHLGVELLRRTSGGRCHVQLRMLREPEQRFA